MHHLICARLLVAHDSDDVAPFLDWFGLNSHSAAPLGMLCSIRSLRASIYISLASASYVYVDDYLGLLVLVGFLIHLLILVSSRTAQFLSSTISVYHRSMHEVDVSAIHPSLSDYLPTYKPHPA